LDVRIDSVPCDIPDRLIVLRISDRGGIFLNLEEEPDWRRLQIRLSEIYAMRAHRVLYLLADEGVPFQTVANAVDAVTSTPENINVQLITPKAVDAGCSERRLTGSSTRHALR
jgi:biopolymer transport protein ExbD